MPWLVISLRRDSYVNHCVLVFFALFKQQQLQEVSNNEHCTKEQKNLLRQCRQCISCKGGFVHRSSFTKCLFRASLKPKRCKQPWKELVFCKLTCEKPIYMSVLQRKPANGLYIIIILYTNKSLLGTTFSPWRIIWLWYKLTHLCKQDFVLYVNNIYQRRSGAVFLSSAQA